MMHCMGKNAAELALRNARPIQGGAAGDKLKARWDERNDQATALLAESCIKEPGPYNVILNALGGDPRPSCSDLLLMLEVEYNIVDNVYIAQQQRDFNNLLMVAREQASSFMARIQEKKQTLIGLGKAISDDIDCLGILINALDRDPRFGHLTAAIRMENVPILSEPSYDPKPTPKFPLPHPTSDPTTPEPKSRKTSAKFAENRDT
jgi:hypothetical protein